MRIEHEGGRRMVCHSRIPLGSWVLGAAIGLLCLVFVAGSVQGAGKAVMDGDIRRAIEVDLWIDDAMDANDIDVETAEGIVTLTGTVDSILARERAEEISENIAGVRAVVNRIEVADGDRGDAELAKAVKTALLYDPAADAYEVEVSASGGTVTLEGTVDSWAERQLCVDAAKGVRGVRAVNDELVVRYSSDRPDTEVQAEVESRLANDVRVDDYGIQVAVDDGDVTLSGVVGSLAEKRQAEIDAWVAGVESVDAGGLEVEWWARDEMRRKSVYASRSDQEIQKAVRDALLYDPRVLSFNPEVHVSGGTVTLRGVVDNLAARRAAEEDARNVIGVWRVRNHLKVRPAALPSDEELEKRVRRAIREDEYVERWEILVEADSGEVRLAGKVDNSFEKTRAELLAERTKGVTRVVNNLEYEHQWVWKPDWEIREDVKDQLFWSPFVDEGDVTVAVENGVVTLTGQVDTWPERTAAEDNAWEAGAKDVRNELSVRYTHFGPLAHAPFIHPAGKLGTGSVNPVRSGRNLQSSEAEA